MSVSGWVPIIGLDCDPVATKRTIPETDRDHWATIRAAANEAYLEALAAGPDADEDLMGAIAWRSQFPEHGVVDTGMMNMINEARPRATWRELAVAQGLSEASEGTAYSKQQWRNHRASQV